MFDSLHPKYPITRTRGNRVFHNHLPESTRMQKKTFIILFGVGVAALALASVAVGVSHMHGRLYGEHRKSVERVSGERGDRFMGESTERGSWRNGGRGMIGGRSRGMDRTTCLDDQCLSVTGLDYPVGTLSDAAKQSLGAALDDEYKALATYQAVIAKQGMVRPFSMISRAEEQHISQLKGLFDKYGVTIPENPYLSKVTAPDTLQAACQTGVEAEQLNVALYRDTLLPTVKEYPDITRVFTNLMSASQYRHLPAFDQCN